MSATGPIGDLARLLRELEPRLHEGSYAFCMLRPGEAVPANVASAIMTCFGLIPAFFVGISGLWWLVARRASP